LTGHFENQREIFPSFIFDGQLTSIWEVLNDPWSVVLNTALTTNILGADTVHRRQLGRRKKSNWT